MTAQLEAALPPILKRWALYLGGLAVSFEKKISIKTSALKKTQFMQF